MHALSARTLRCASGRTIVHIFNFLHSFLMRPSETVSFEQSEAFDVRADTFTILIEWFALFGERFLCELPRRLEIKILRMCTAAHTDTSLGRVISQQRSPLHELNLV
ncbi:hypothetical protein PsYK624_144970 [Phanerochaete sordida]|uniref:Uncharacterized protein n=1 Tax=Phanerochaete sordida TaxID=48140 RepID=A0A9P3GNJ8_9APHY|nr:hypothetical protein PsYK624_144970 [Phanerochaete sordida]